MKKSAQEFYHRVADEYDAMTRFQERLEREKDVLQRWVERYRFRSALDVACGTGLHVILLTQMGVRVAGVDISSEMLDKARENARRFEVQAEWIQTSMQELVPPVKSHFDAVLCLGNSLPHLLTPDSLKSALRNFYQLLYSGGIAIIQLLNYERLLSRKQRIIGIHRQGEKEFIRFYDFPGETVIFNILTIQWEGDNPQYQLNATELLPYRKPELENALRNAGFENLQFFGNMEFTEYQTESSPNLVIVAKKGNKA